MVSVIIGQLLAALFFYAAGSLVGPKVQEFFAGFSKDDDKAMSGKGDGQNGGSTFKTADELNLNNNVGQSDVQRQISAQSSYQNTTPPPPSSSSPSPDLGKLLLCLLIDIIGSSNELIPVVGEVVDIVYAPIAALLLRQLFNGSNVVLALEFTEEILPFTDILPLATICWVVEAFFYDSDFARLLNIGAFAPNVVIQNANAAADVNSNVDVYRDSYGGGGGPAGSGAGGSRTTQDANMRNDRGIVDAEVIKKE